MKDKLISSINGFVVLIPWTILLVRLFDWALESPNAEHIILGYAAFMIVGGIFSLLSYSKVAVKTNLLRISLVINSIYLLFGLFAAGTILL